jgi:hypothetical protein
LTHKNINPGEVMLRAVALLLLLMLGGCAQTTALHLQRASALAGQSGTLTMRHAAFDYTTVALDHQVGVVGTARLVPASVPSWAKHVAQYVVYAYICDTSGNVLASGDIDFIPRTIEESGALPFEIRIDTRFQPGDRPLQLAFGYRIVLRESSMPDEGRSFVATEVALEE